MYELQIIESESEMETFEVELRSAEEVKCFYRSLCDSSRSTAMGFVECGEAFRSFALFDEALECYGEAIARDSGCLQAYVRRGELFFEIAVCGGSDEEILRFGWRSVDDFRKALVLSLGTNDVVWRLGIALLLVDDAAGVQALADNVIMKGDAVPSWVRCDFLYLSGMAKVFTSDKLGADELFEELVGLDCAESGWFGKLVCCMALSDGAGAEVILTQLQLRDVVLWKAGQSLQRSGCSRFSDVAKALFDVRSVAAVKAPGSQKYEGRRA
jgi:hypothetical protein